MVILRLDLTIKSQELKSMKEYQYVMALLSLFSMGLHVQVGVECEFRRTSMALTLNDDRSMGGDKNHILLNRE